MDKYPQGSNTKGSNIGTIAASLICFGFHRLSLRRTKITWGPVAPQSSAKRGSSEPLMCLANCPGSALLYTKIR